MTKLLATAAIACAGAAVLFAQTTPAARSWTTVGALYERARSQTAPTVAAQVPDAKAYRAFVNKYCVGCHNSRNAQGGTDPANLEKATVDDVLPTAAPWERVLANLS